MNRRMIGRTVGKITLLEAVLLVLPMLVCAIYREWLQLFAFFAAAASAAIIGVLLTVISKPRTTEIFVREGFITVALASDLFRIPYSVRLVKNFFKFFKLYFQHFVLFNSFSSLS